MKLDQAQKIAEELAKLLEPACERVQVAGSIRRRKPEPHDIELLVIPQFLSGIDQLDLMLKMLVMGHVLGLRRNKRGAATYGQLNKLMVHLPSGIGVDVFSTSAENWPNALVVRTGGKETNQAIATAALKKGWGWHAYGRGFRTADGGEFICRSERDVFQAVGLPYLEPWERV